MPEPDEEGEPELPVWTSNRMSHVRPDETLQNEPDEPLQGEPDEPRDISVHICEHSFVMNSSGLLRSLSLNDPVFVSYCT